MNNEEKFYFLRKSLQICFEDNGRETSAQKKFVCQIENITLAPLNCDLKARMEKFSFFL